MWRGKKLDELLSDKRIIRIACWIGAAAVAVILLSTIVDFSPDNGAAITQKYADKTEQRLLEIISQIDGVGEAEIFLTMENGTENVFRDDSDTKTVSIEPKVRGVVIVCEGGDDPLVTARVMEAVTKSLNIHSDKVCITK